MGVTENGKVQLAEIGLAAGALGLRFRLGKTRQEQRRQDGNDRDDHQQLNQSEGRTGKGVENDVVHEP